MQYIRTNNAKAERENDSTRIIKVKYNGTPGVTRVETGDFYIVEGTSENGLLTNITVKSRPDN